jgi:hypothetical protein
MSKLLIAVAFTAALSTSALAVPSHVQSRSEPPHWRSQARNGQTNDPYWKPCHFSRYGGMNTCD